MKASTIAIDTAPLSVFRFLAVVTVVFIHYGSNIRIIILFPNVITRGGAIITFFFILSGFGLFLSSQKRGNINLRQYFIKRVLRILPFYYLALFLMTLIFLISGGFSTKKFFLAFFCIQSWFPDYQHSINPPGWFVADLLFFYCIFPVIFSRIKKIKPDADKLLLSSILLWIAVIIVLNSLLSFFPDSYYNYIDCFPISWFSSFYMGICGAYFIKSNKRKNKWVCNNSTWQTLLILILCSLIIMIHQGELAELIERKFPFEANLYAPILLLMIINLSTSQNHLTNILSSRFFMLLGIISYPLYIFQAPIHSIYFHFVSKPMKLQPGMDFILFFSLFMIFAGGVTIVENKTFRKIYLKISLKSLNAK